MSRPTRLQWLIIWPTLLVSAHIWLELDASAILPPHPQAAVKPPVSAQIKEVDNGTERSLGKGWTIVPNPDYDALAKQNGAISSVYPCEPQQRAWGLPGYLRPALENHRMALVFTILLMGSLLVWQAKGKKATK